MLDWHSCQKCYPLEIKILLLLLEYIGFIFFIYPLFCHLFIMMMQRQNVLDLNFIYYSNMRLIISPWNL